MNVAKNVVYAVGNTRPQGTVFAFVKAHLNHKSDRDTFAWFEENFQIKSTLEKKKANVSKKDILENFDKYRIGSNMTDQMLASVKTWLVHR